MIRATQLASLFVILSLAVLVSPIRTGDKVFVKIFNGKDLSGLKIMPPKADDTFKAEDGVLRVSGKPNGYFYTDKSYKNFHLKFDWRYPVRPGNSALLVYIQPPHRIFLFSRSKDEGPKDLS